MSIFAHWGHLTREKLQALDTKHRNVLGCPGWLTVLALVLLVSGITGVSRGSVEPLGPDTIPLLCGLALLLIATHVAGTFLSRLDRYLARRNQDQIYEIRHFGTVIAEITSKKLADIDRAQMQSSKFWIREISSASASLVRSVARIPVLTIKFALLGALIVYLWEEMPLEELSERSNVIILIELSLTLTLILLTVERVLNTLLPAFEARYSEKSDILEAAHITGRNPSEIELHLKTDSKEGEVSTPQKNSAGLA